MNLQYSMTVQWSDGDRCFVVFLPDFARIVNQPCADGRTYAEAAKHGQEVLETLIDVFQAEGKTLPQPCAFFG